MTANSTHKTWKIPHKAIQDSCLYINNTEIKELIAVEDNSKLCATAKGDANVIIDINGETENLTITLLSVTQLTKYEKIVTFVEKLVELQTMIEKQASGRIKAIRTENDWFNIQERVIQESTTKWKSRVNQQKLDFFFIRYRNAKTILD